MIKFQNLCRWSLRLGLASVLIPIVTACTYAVFSGPYRSAKYRPVSLPDQVIERAEPLVPEEQVEGHTCGLHALSSVYRAYGLDPAEQRLRFRLGVDRNAVPGATDTEGTLHPDLFRVVNQDGFHIALIDPERPDAHRALVAHLLHDAALVLIQRGEGLHWIALDHGGDDEVRVSDSLEPEAYLSDAIAFFDRPILSVILLTPRNEADSQTIPALHAAGLEEMTRVYDRMGDSKE